MAKTPGGSSGPGKEDSMLNGHKEGEANPFAEYMWMENEEEYNRQVSVTSNAAQGVLYGHKVYDLTFCVSILYMEKACVGWSPGLSLS